MGYQWDLNGSCLILAHVKIVKWCQMQWCLSHGKLCRLTSVIIMIIMIDEREEWIMQLCWCQLLCSFYLLISQFRSLSGTARHSLLESSFNIKQNALSIGHVILCRLEIGAGPVHLSQVWTCAQSAEPPLTVLVSPLIHHDSSGWSHQPPRFTKIHQVQLRHHKSRLWHQINRGKPEVFRQERCRHTWHPLASHRQHGQPMTTNGQPDVHWEQWPGDARWPSICHLLLTRTALQLGRGNIGHGSPWHLEQQTWALDGPWWPLALTCPCPCHILLWHIACGTWKTQKHPLQMPLGVHDNSSLEFLDCFHQGIDGFHVKVVCRLIQIN